MYPRRINECIKREHYEMPRREDIHAELAGAKVFSRLDAKAGFHQVPLDDSTSRICTFATPFGRYRFLRLPFGISSASEVFQKTLNEIFESLPGIRVYVDDILVWGTSREQHDRCLKSALEAAKRAGLALNAEKCKVGVEEIEFIGDVISEKGITPNRQLVNCIAGIPAPTDKRGVQRLLGVANYFSKYIPSLAEKTHGLRSLIKHDAIFEWSPSHAKEWAEMCECLSRGPVLAIFDPLKETKVTSDASLAGLGSTLLQLHGDSWHHVAYASRTLSSVKQRYSQIEKEALAVTFGCQKFHLRPQDNVGDRLPSTDSHR